MPAETRQPRSQTPEGLGGWMMLPLFITFMTPLQGVISIFGYILSIISAASLVEIRSDVKILIGVELAVSATMVAAWIYCAMLMFTHSWKYPRWFIGLLLSALLLNIADMTALGVLFGRSPTNGTLALASLSLLYCLIWIPYMLMSKRVRNTFVQ